MRIWWSGQPAAVCASAGVSPSAAPAAAPCISVRREIRLRCVIVQSPRDEAEPSRGFIATPARLAFDWAGDQDGGQLFKGSEIMPRTLFEKIWDAHLVAKRADGRELIYIDRHVLH